MAVENSRTFLDSPLFPPSSREKRHTTAMLFYWQSGDDASAQVCREKLLAIPDMLEEVRRSTDPLGWKIADQPQLTLPEEYLDILEKLRRG